MIQFDQHIFQMGWKAPTSLFRWNVLWEALFFSSKKNVLAKRREEQEVINLRSDGGPDSQLNEVVVME